jgi:hypothetical protein
MPLQKLTIDRMHEVPEHPDLDQYIATALWSTDDSNGDSLARVGYDLSDATRLEMNVDLTAFCALVGSAGLADHQEIIDGDLAHDFWLTRNHHGSGFWGGDYPETGDRLSELSKKMGECELYVDDDNLVEIA